MNTGNLWEICCNLEVQMSYINGLICILDHILADAESECLAAAEPPDTGRALCFVSRYQLFSKILFTVSNCLSDAETIINRNIDAAFAQIKAMKTKAEV